MAEFYVEKNTQEDGNHHVHKATCTSLPAAKEAIHYLGSFSSGISAIKKASEHFNPAIGCSECSTASNAA